VAWGPRAAQEAFGKAGLDTVARYVANGDAELADSTVEAWNALVFSEGKFARIVGETFCDSRKGLRAPFATGDRRSLAEWFVAVLRNDADRYRDLDQHLSSRNVRSSQKRTTKQQTKEEQLYNEAWAHMVRATRLAPVKWRLTRKWLDAHRYVPRVVLSVEFSAAIEIVATLLAPHTGFAILTDQVFVATSSGLTPSTEEAVLRTERVFLCGPEPSRSLVQRVGFVMAVGSLVHKERIRRTFTQAIEQL
jgi:hypothetical protein